MNNFYNTIISKKSVIIFTSIFMFVISLLAAEMNNKIEEENKNEFPLKKDLITSPGRTNKLVASFKIDSKETIQLKEFDVFGLPKYDMKSKKITKQQRFEKIKNKVLDKILINEGKSTDIDKSLSYKNNRDKMMDKNAVIYFYDYRIVDKFVSDKDIKSYYNENRKKFVKDFDNEKKKIKDLLIGVKREEIGTYAKFYMDSLRTSYKVYYNDSLFDEIISRFNFNSKQKLIDSISTLSKNETLVKYGKTDLNVSYLISRIEKVKPMNIPLLKKRENALKYLMDGSIVNELLASEAKKTNIYDLPEINKQSDFEMESYIGSIYKKRLFSENKFFPTGIDVENYYIDNKYKDESLKSKYKAQVYEIIMFYEDNDDDPENDKLKVYAKMETLRQKIINSKEEKEFEKYAKFYNRPHSRDGFLGWIFKDDLSLIGETAAKLKEAEISDLIVQKKAISMIKVTKVKEPQVYAIKYVEEIIKQKLMKENRKNYKEKVIGELFTKYQVKIID